MGVKLPAKLIVVEENRIIAAAISFICMPPLGLKQIAPQLNQRASKKLKRAFRTEAGEYLPLLLRLHGHREFAPCVLGYWIVARA